MDKSNAPTMMAFHIPTDEKLLAAFGTVGLVHAHLDHILRMTIKTLANLTPQEALDATAMDGSAVLRDRVRKLARSRLGEGPALLKLQALLQRCKRVTEKRNELVHSVWAREMDGDPMLRAADHSWKPLPTVDELDMLAKEIAELVMELNTARLEGFLHDALTKKSPFE